MRRLGQRMNHPTPKPHKKFTVFIYIYYTRISIWIYIYIYSQGWFMYYVFRLYRTCLCVSVRVSRVGAYVYFLCAHHWKILCFPLHISLRDYIHLASTCLKILTQFLDAGCPFMLQTKMKHTHTHIYTYYINICLEPPFFFFLSGAGIGPVVK